METVTRHQAIEDIRQEVLKLVDDDHSICEVAARLGIFCRGFRQFSNSDLEQRYDWIVKKKNPKTRVELEGFANRWQLARQFVQNKSLACDVQTAERDTCGGWTDFDDAALVRFHKELCEKEIEIRG